MITSTTEFLNKQLRLKNEFEKGQEADRIEHLKLHEAEKTKALSKLNIKIQAESKFEINQ